MKKHLWVLILLILPKAVPADDFQVSKLSDEKRESYDRSVDLVALGSQKHAIQTLQGLIKKHKGRTQEILLELKLGEAYQQAAYLEFRIQKGVRKATSVVKYHQDTIRTLSDVIARAPNLPEIDQAYALRGKSYEEIDDKPHAKKDYLYLVKNFPDHPSTSPAYMSLADFAIVENNHDEALTYLKALEKRDYDPLYPFALFKMAWSYYNLKNVPTSLAYLEKHSEYYLKKIESSKVPSPSDEALRESSLADMALFFFEGYESKAPGYGTEDAYRYFSKRNAGSVFGRMSVRFAKLLRAHKHSQGLEEWKNIYLAKEYDRPETLEILTIQFDDYVNQNSFEKVGATSKDMISLYLKNKKLMQGEVLSKTQKIILDTAQKYQNLTLKNKNASESEELKILTHTLATLYDSFTKMTEDSDPRIPRVHYNLAETLFEIKSFDESTVHYRWIVDRGQVKDSIPIDDASLKSISARYESLKSKDLVKLEIKAKKYQGDSEPSQSGEFREWVKWIDWHLDKYGHKDEGVSQFLYEANRNLYLLKASDPVLTRLKTFAMKHPTSKYAIPQATLTLDTAILSEQWERAWLLTQDFVDVDAWKKTDFYKLLIQTGSKSIFKLTEADFEKNKHVDVLAHYKLYTKKFSDDGLLPQMILFAAKSALALNDESSGTDHLSNLIEKQSKSKFVAEALLLRSKIRQEKEDFVGAGKDWISFLSLDEKLKSGLKFKTDEILKRAFLFATLSNTLKDRFKEIQTAKLCEPSDHRELCEHYEAYLAVTEPSLYPKQKCSEMAKNEEIEAPTRGLWALAALKYSKEMNIDEIHSFVRIVGSKFEKNEADVQLSLFKVLKQYVIQSLVRGRESLNKDYALKEDANKIIKSIQRRVKAMQRHEETQASLMKLSSFGLRAYVFNDTSIMYEDFTNALRNYPMPADMKQEEIDEFQKAFQDILFPFEEKVQAIRMKAFELAAQKAVDEPTFIAVAEGYFKDNPSQAKTLGNAFTKGFRVPLTLDTFRDETFSPQWKSAYEKGHTRLMLYLLPREKSPVAKVLTLESIGLTSEALIELEKIKNQNDQMIVLTHHFATLNQRRVKSASQVIVDELTSQATPPKINEQIAFIVYYTATHWAPFTLTENIRDKLGAKARGVDHREARDWMRNGQKK
ncbi:MAG: hypothetical protein KA715_09960 [Xanthomonadaceae bacterium]|nr:hypothetical protein [Xanthomonadaceae bacterium]